MTCGCGSTGVLNTILGKDFYYCRECKIEIELETPKLTHNPKKKETQLDFFLGDGVDIRCKHQAIMNNLCLYCGITVIKNPVP